MGSIKQFDPSKIMIDSTWFANDGVVNTISMKTPKGQPIRNDEGTLQRGTWNYPGYYDQYDHGYTTGWLVPGYMVYPVYEYLTSIIYGL